MSEPKRYQGLDGIYARNEWLTLIVKSIEVVARERLLNNEEKRFAQFPSTSAEEKLFKAHVGLERQRTQKAKKEMNEALDDIDDMGKQYAQRLRAPKQLPPLDSVEAGRHVPFLTVEAQSLLQDMALTRARPDELEKIGLDRKAFQDGTSPREIVAEELGSLITAQRRAEGVVPQPADTAQSNDQDLVAVFDTMNKLLKIVPDDPELVLKISPEKPVTPQQSSDRMMAQKFASIKAHQVDLMKLYRGGDEQEKETIDQSAQHLFKAYLPQFARDLEGFTNDLHGSSLQARQLIPADGTFRAGRAPTAGVAASSGLSSIQNLQITPRAP
ncbi:hypothetical protein PRZ48_007352 [Zasmidium cellare]|uniref:Uncharacterized protein n=1 Tax=Zasmidium cellare TaxID=395010 RepID=A0ABR0EJZ0_ZASCE|nr:hypothetical protein PRZ48_007352 [Zasmidium cellare]